jgi:peroxiredoxin
MVSFRALLFLAGAIAGAQQVPGPAAEGNSPFLSVAPVLDALRFETPFPDFEAKDTEGRVWRSADLRGKLTVVDIWSTFGGVHNVEHPELQRFYDKVKNSGRIQVLTFCTDFDYTHAPVYMKQNNYTFPVVADWSLARKLFGSVGNLSKAGYSASTLRSENPGCPQRFPEQWVINGDVRLSSQFCSWSFGRILMEVERAAAGGGEQK